MPIIVSKLGSNIGALLRNRSYWAVKLRDGTWLSEVDLCPQYRPETPYYDWSLDLVGTGDVARIRELWLFAPPNRLSPLGNTAVLFFRPDEHNTAFQLHVTGYNTSGRVATSQIIGRVIDKATGDCIAHIWDAKNKVMVVNWETNINTFKRWEEEVAKQLKRPLSKVKQTAPPGALAKDVHGLY